MKKFTSDDANRIEEALKSRHKEAMENPNSRYALYFDLENGEVRTLEDVAGGNTYYSNPDLVRFAEFCFQGWEPEEGWGDGKESVVETLSDYLTEEEKEKFAEANRKQIEEYDEPLSLKEIKKLFPDAYEKMIEFMIDSYQDAYVENQLDFDLQNAIEIIEKY